VKYGFDNMWSHPFFKLSVCAISAITLYGCANSASHQVMKKEKAGDEFLTCREIDREIRKARIVIRGVEQDKEDMTGDDVIDGLLWFPFNVIAKQSNYSSATKAAEGRIEHLRLLEVQQGCRDNLASPGKTGSPEAADLEIANQLRQLNSLYKSGVLSEEEYILKKKEILDRIGNAPTHHRSVARTEANHNTSADYPLMQKPIDTTTKKEDPKESGKHLYQAEKLAMGKECTRVNFMVKDSTKDIYSANCKTGLKIISCEWGSCVFVE